MSPDDAYVPERRRLRRPDREVQETKAILVLVLLAVMLFSIGEALDWYEKVVPLDAFSEMTLMLFHDYIVAFEVLGFLLLAALVGALYLAQKEALRRV